MFDLIKKSILAGIGAVVITAEKVQEATRRLVEEGKISTEEAERLADDLVRSGEKQWEELSGKVSESMKRGMDNLDFIRRKEYQDLRTRVELLEQRVILLEDAYRRENGATQ